MNSHKTNMAAVLLFRDTNMAYVTSCVREGRSVRIYSRTSPDGTIYKDRLEGIGGHDVTNVLQKRWYGDACVSVNVLKFFLI